MLTLLIPTDEPFSVLPWIGKRLQNFFMLNERVAMLGRWHPSPVRDQPRRFVRTLLLHCSSAQLCWSRGRRKREARPDQDSVKDSMSAGEFQSRTYCVRLPRLFAPSGLLQSGPYLIWRLSGASGGNLTM